jgi:DNA repair protein RecO (recombination protein O)
MAINKTEAVVLRSRELRETSLIVTFYTQGFGKINGVIKGVRGPRSQHGGGALEPFARDEVVFYERKASEFLLVSQCDLLDFFPAARGNLERLAHATYIVELLDSLTPLGDKNEKIYELLVKSLSFLCRQASPRRVARIFEIRLLDLVGIMPVMARCANCSSGELGEARFSLRSGGLVCKNCAGADKSSSQILPGTIEFMKRIAASDFESTSRIKVSERVGKNLESLLRKFLDYHIERRLNTVEFLASIGA